MSKIADTLNKWLDYCSFDPNQTSFNLCNNSYDLHKKNQLLIDITNQYDQSGTLAIIYAKCLLKSLFESTEISLWDILNNKHSFEKERELFNSFNDVEIIECENQFVSKLNELYKSLFDGKIIGIVNNEETKNNFFKGIQRIVEGLKILHLDVFKTSGLPILQINHFYTRIFVFETMRDCLLSIEKTNVEDGMYLVHISDHNSAGCYFSFIIKSNGNIISINERVDESYVGQHKNCRNARWSDDKNYKLFPYDQIFDYDNYDYKGYATQHIIDQTKLDFKDLSEDMRTTIIISMFLLSKKYYNSTFTVDQLKYVNNLLPININILKSINNDQNQLVVYNNSSLVKSHENLNLKFDLNKILTGEYDHEFNNNNKNRDYREHGWFNGFNQQLVDAFGQDFKIQEDEIFKTDISKLLTDSLLLQKAEQQNYIPNSEFVGSKKKFELEAYYEIRKQLALHIKEKQEQSLQEFGGIKQFKQWYINQLKNNIKYIYNLCGQVAKGNEDIQWDSLDHEKRKIKWIEYQSDTKYPKNVWIKLCLNEMEDYQTTYCPITGSKQTKYWFIFRPINTIYLQKLCNCNLPNFLTGWKNDDFGDNNYVGKDDKNE